MAPMGTSPSGEKMVADPQRGKKAQRLRVGSYSPAVTTLGAWGLPPGWLERDALCSGRRQLARDAGGERDGHAVVMLYPLVLPVAARVVARSSAQQDVSTQLGALHVLGRGRVRNLLRLLNQHVGRRYSRARELLGEDWVFGAPILRDGLAMWHSFLRAEREQRASGVQPSEHGIGLVAGHGQGRSSGALAARWFRHAGMVARARAAGQSAPRGVAYPRGFLRRGTVFSPYRV